MSAKPRISIPVSTGKSEKLVVSFDAPLMSELRQYIKFTASTFGGEEISTTRMLKLITEAFLNEDKDFATWKKNPVASKNAKPEPTPAPPVAPPSSNNNGQDPFYANASG